MFNECFYFSIEQRKDVHESPLGSVVKQCPIFHSLTPALDIDVRRYRCLQKKNEIQR